MVMFGYMLLALNIDVT